MFLLDIPDDAPAPIKEALSRRNTCSLVGVCPCGAVGHIEHRDDYSVWHFEHADDCNAPDCRIEQLSDELGWPA